MPNLKLTQAHSDYPTRREALLAALERGEPIREALAYAGLGASTVRGYIKRGTYDDGSGSCHSSEGRECGSLFKALSRLRALEELRCHEAGYDLEHWHHYVGWREVWPYQRDEFSGRWFGRESGRKRLLEEGEPLAVKAQERHRLSCERLGLEAYEWAGVEV